MFNSTLDRGLAFCKENSCTCESLGYQYGWQRLQKEKRKTCAYEIA
jgi:hypothetical protein